MSSWQFAACLMLGGSTVLLFIGMPVALTFISINIIGAWLYMGGEPGMVQLVRSSVSSVMAFSLTPIPLFVLMGEILFHTGLAFKVIEGVERLIMRVPGRLAVVAVVAGTVFSAISGSTIATTAMLGSLMLPVMLARGYHPTIATGPIMAIGAVDMLIPPSALTVLLGSLSGISISKLLIGGVVPGLLLSICFVAWIIIRVRISPHLAPTMVLAACYRVLKWDAVLKSLKGTAGISGMILFIILGATTFAQILSFSGASTGLVQFITGQGLSTSWIVVGMMLILIFLGIFVDQVSMMMITLPIFMPIVTSLGIDPIWFGVMFLICMQLGLLLPPHGLLLMTMRGVAPPSVTMTHIFLAVGPYVVMSLILLTAVFLIPGIATWLPGWIG